MINISFHFLKITHPYNNNILYHISKNVIDLNNTYYEKALPSSLPAIPNYEVDSIL